MLNGLSEQEGDLIGSPRALYEEGVVQPLVFTILRPSQRAWWAHFDNVRNLRGSLGLISCFLRQIKIIKYAGKMHVGPSKCWNYLRSGRHHTHHQNSSHAISLPQEPKSSSLVAILIIFYLPRETWYGPNCLLECQRCQTKPTSFSGMGVKW